MDNDGRRIKCMTSHWNLGKLEAKVFLLRTATCIEVVLATLVKTRYGEQSSLFQDIKRPPVRFTQ